jgi:uncharacterized membrane protein
MTTHLSKRVRANWLSLPAISHIAIAAVLGVVAAVITGMRISWLFAPLAFWDVTALVAMGVLWFSLRTLDTEETKKHATREDPGQGTVIVLMLLASVASLAAVLFVIIDASSAHGIAQAGEVAFGIVSVLISWLSVHTVFTLRYAAQYFAKGSKGSKASEGAIDFNSDEPPIYQDFAYVAFTIGMTYQVSDTALKTSQLRRTARQHALLSYLFGTAIIATVINAVAGLGK